MLLIVAPNEHKVRIEVGYGLEGTLTDALSKIIIDNAILPKFRAGDYAGGIKDGVRDIIKVLTGDAAEVEDRAKARPDADEPAVDWLMVIFWVLMLSWIAYSVYRERSAMPLPPGGGGAAVGPIFLPGPGWGGGSAAAAGAAAEAAASPAAAADSAAAAPRGAGTMMQPFTDEERAAIEAAITRAEKKTSGEIVVVVAPASDGYWSFALMWSALLALAVPLPLIFATKWPVEYIYLLQLGVFAACVALAMGAAPPRRHASLDPARPCAREGRRAIPRPEHCTPPEAAPACSSTSPSPSITPR